MVYFMKRKTKEFLHSEKNGFPNFEMTHTHTTLPHFLPEFKRFPLAAPPLAPLAPHTGRFGSESIDISLLLPIRGLGMDEGLEEKEEEKDEEAGRGAGGGGRGRGEDLGVTGGGPKRL